MDLRPDGAPHSFGRAHFVVLNQTLGPFFRQTAETLADRGHRVTVLAGASSAFTRPGVTFVAGPSPDRTTIRSRFRSWLEFLLFVRKTLPTRFENAVLLSSSNPPLLPHVCALMKPRIVHHVTRILDVYPDVLQMYPRIAHWPGLQPVWRLANRLAYRQCESVITLGDVMARTLSRDLDHMPNVIPDWSTIDATHVPPRDKNPLRKELSLGERIVVLYSGNIGLAHDLGVLVDAAEALGNDDGVRFVIIGEGPGHDQVRAAARSRGVDRLFVFLPYQPKDRLPLSMGLGDWSVVAVAAGAENALMPSKTYDYLAAGSAILAIAGRPSDLAAIIERYRCGVVIGRDDTAALVAAIKTAVARDSMFGEMRANAKRAATEVFSGEIQCARLVSLLEEVAERRDPESTSSISVANRSLRWS